MILTRRFNPKLALYFGTRIVVLAGSWAVVVFCLYAYGGLTFIKVPFLPIATIGTAVAFYVGFKNNSAYERFWEGRKIWGGIVNESRSFTTYVLSYVYPGDEGAEAREVRRELIYRHLAWINALRVQLRRTSRFFDKPARTTKRRLESHAEHMRNDWDKELRPFLSEEEHLEVKEKANSATHLLLNQGRSLDALKRAGHVDLFHQISIMEVVRECYALQGKAERIKATPFPRQYAEYSRIFTRVFIFFVPFGMLDVFGERIDNAVSTVEHLLPVIPMFLASGIVTWVFNTMEAIGDMSEDPFERSMNDVPMNALCRVIEIDLRQMLGEAEVPEKEQPIDGLLY